MPRHKRGPRATACKHADRPDWSKGYCHTCYQKFHRRENPEARAKHLARNWESRIRCHFGITPEQYYAILAEQDHRCWICRSEKKTKMFSVDHCHKTGIVRGMLCSKCNSALGWFEKHGERMRLYLNKAENHGVVPNLAKANREKV